MSAPLVSVVLLTYQRVELLRVSLASVLGQTFADIEVLVMDNESTDGTPDFVAQAAAADPRVRYIRHPNGGNLAVNRNVGIREARGEWVALLDDDDVWEPAKVERQLAVAAAVPDAGLLCTNAIYFAGDEEYGRIIRRTGDSDVTASDMLSGRLDVLTSTVMARRDVLLATGLFDEDQAIRTVEDYDLFARVAFAGHRIRFIDEPLVRFRVHPTSASHRDTRVTIRLGGLMFERMHDRGLITDEQLATARASTRRLLRRATLKEWVKRIPGAKRYVYLRRRARHSAGGGR